MVTLDQLSVRGMRILAGSSPRKPWVHGLPMSKPNCWPTVIQAPCEMARRCTLLSYLAPSSRPRR